MTNRSPTKLVRIDPEVNLIIAIINRAREDANGNTCGEKTKAGREVAIRTAMEFLEWLETEKEKLKI